MPGGAAEANGRIFSGDKVVSINGQSCEERHHHEVVQMLRNTDTLQVVVAHNALQKRRLQAKKASKQVATGRLDIDLHRVGTAARN